MSTQEMEQMDREVMAMVNNHANPEAEEAAEEILKKGRIATPVCGLVRNDMEDEGAAEKAGGPEILRCEAPQDDTEEVDPLSHADRVTALPEGEPRLWDCRENADPVENGIVKTGEGKYCITKEEFAKLEAEVEKRQRRKTAVCVVLCVLIAAALLVTLAKPELLVWLVSLGVISCSVVAGIAVDRWARRKVW